MADFKVDSKGVITPAVDRPQETWPRHAQFNTLNGAARAVEDILLVELTTTALTGRPNGEVLVSRSWTSPVARLIGLGGRR